MVSLGAAMCFGSAEAQVGEASAAVSLEPVSVTGSRIKRIDSESASPLQVIGREQIERSGALSVGAVLAVLPAANVGSLNESLYGSGYTPGAASASLRGLGSQATLVLVNGRRVAPFGFGDGGQFAFVDLNQIPLDVVDRIEVLLDGASAIYGSDAIGGVINVILRRDYRGLAAGVSYGKSTHGDADAVRATWTAGTGDLGADGYNAFIAYEHAQQSPVTLSRRENTQSGDYRRFGLADRRSSYAYPGNLYTASGFSGGAFIGPVAGCAPLAEAGAATNGRCVYDLVDHLDAVVRSRRDIVSAAATLNLPGRWQLFSDASIGRTRFDQENTSLASSVYFSTGTLPEQFIRLPAGHPQNPLPDADAALRYRFADVPSFVTTQTDARRVVLGVRHPDLGDWDVESGLLHSHAKTSITTTGYINDNVLRDEVLDEDGRARPGFIFGQPSANDASLIGRLYPRLRDVGTTANSSVDARGSRDLIRLPGGPLVVSVGAEFRHESFTSIPDALVSSGAISVLGSQTTRGSRNVAAAYTEFALPLRSDLEASLAGRWDRYSDFGSTVNPKVGIKWRPVSMLALRATYGTGFRAPALTETSTTPTSFFVGPVRDPRLCPVDDEDNPNCHLDLPAQAGANPNLKAEKSRGWTAGFVFQPFADLSLSVDTFRTRRRNEITLPTADYLLAHEADFPGAVRRGADGTIEFLDLTYANLSTTRVVGYDVELKGSRTVPEVGKLGAVFTYSSLPHFYSAGPAGPELDYAGLNPLPRSRFQLRLSLDRGPWSTSLGFNYVGAFRLQQSPDTDCSLAGTAYESECTVKSFLTTDLFVGYRPTKSLELGVTVGNLDNRQPPVNAASFTLYTPQYHSALGRYFQASMKYAFR